MLTKENLEKLEKLKTQYPTTKSLMLHALWMAQEQFGWISPQTMDDIAGLLNVPRNHVFGVVTFYTMFHTKPVGKYHLQVCTNVSCMLRGAERLCTRLCQRLGINVGETSPDQKFTLSAVECLGSCGSAPVIQVNDDYQENLSEAHVDQLLSRLR